MSVKCVFDPEKKCPVRKAIQESITTKNDVNKIIKPVGGEELLKMFAPILDKMERTMHSEFGLLHYYCAVCRASIPCPP